MIWRERERFSWVVGLEGRRRRRRRSEKDDDEMKGAGWNRETQVKYAP